jgi:hypothetical protein
MARDDITSATTPELKRAVQKWLPGPSRIEPHAALDELCDRSAAYDAVDDPDLKKLAEYRREAEFQRERAAILSTAVGIARLDLSQGDSSGARKELDDAAAKTARLLESYVPGMKALRE